MSKDLSRREFGKVAVAAACWDAIAPSAPAVWAQASGGKPALLGGTPVRKEPFPSWPIYGEPERHELTDVLDSGKWCRLDGNHASDFEQKWAAQTGAKHCLATASGTVALFTCLNGLEVGPGDEVIVPPYTFVATINVAVLQYALPVFVDTDRETFQIDANKIEAAITPRTRAILPVHLGGSPADLDKILAIGKAHNIPVLEDACQAHLAEWRGKKVGTLGAAGCFSFQASKNLNSGEGGAILSNNDELMDFCRSFQNNGRGKGNYAYSYVRNGSNHRITEFQAGILLAQLTRLEAQTRTRTANAEYLTKNLKEIDGILPARMYEGTTRNAYHLYMFRYDAERFHGLSRNKFIKALEAEGIPSSLGYGPLNKEPFVSDLPRLRSFQRCFSSNDLRNYQERIQCPENDKLCDEAVWFQQTMLLGSRSDMDQIIEALRKIHSNAAALAKA
jgi:dTDP-4-amino-4,6-dideoxygalactose transaminase